jgi:hypothetical protein
MNFQTSERAQQLRKQLDDFMQREVFPAEAVYAAAMAQASTSAAGLRHCSPGRSAPPLR